MMLGEIITNADTLVVIIPTLVFVIMLPGLLYFDLAFDVQRTFINEMFMCLLPPSGVALILRYLCSFEGSNVKVSWHTRVPISNTPMYWYIIMLVIDILLYLLVAGIVNSIIERRKMMKSLQRHNPNISGFENADIIGQKEKKIYEQEEEDIYEYEVEQSSDHSENSEYENEVSSQKPCLSSLFARGYTFFTLDLCNSSRRFWMWLRGEQLYVVIPTASSHVHFHETPGSVKEAGTKEDMNATSQCITLKVKYLTKQYMTGNVGVVVLSNISADLHSNSITMLLGNSSFVFSTEQM